MVRIKGLEPLRPKGQSILSRSRLPLRHIRMVLAGGFEPLDTQLLCLFVTRFTDEEGEPPAYKKKDLQLEVFHL